jgi:DNA repair exonuclease SbcCD nuclease subunit
VRCHYLSDLHLESQSFDVRLPRGDILIIAGDLCHARCLDPARTDKYSADQRARVLRFSEKATRRFTHVLVVAGNHDHYDSVFEETAGLLRKHLHGVTVLDNEAIEIEGVRLFGTTLWSDFEGRKPEGLDRVRRRMGEYFFVKTRAAADGGNEALRRFRPEDALNAHDRAWAALRTEVSRDGAGRTVVISHHAPSLQGLNPLHRGNGLDGAYVSELDEAIMGFWNIAYWVHGHTHIRRAYRIGHVKVRTNACGFRGRDHSAAEFSPEAHFDVLASSWC